jgi:hypothetical protein
MKGEHECEGSDKDKEEEEDVMDEPEPFNTEDDKNRLSLKLLDRFDTQLEYNNLHIDDFSSGFD